jgi:hypothetical protein
VDPPLPRKVYAEEVRRQLPSTYATPMALGYTPEGFRPSANAFIRVVRSYIKKELIIHVVVGCTYVRWSRLHSITPYVLAFMCDDLRRIYREKKWKVTFT